MSFVIYNFVTYTFIHGIYKVNKNDANNEFVRMRSCFFSDEILTSPITFNYNTI